MEERPLTSLHIRVSFPQSRLRIICRKKRQAAVLQIEWEKGFVRLAMLVLALARCDSAKGDTLRENGDGVTSSLKNKSTVFTDSDDNIRLKAS